MSECNLFRERYYHRIDPSPRQGSRSMFFQRQKAAACAFTLYCKVLTVQYCEKQTDFPNTELLTTESKSFLTGKQLGEGISYKSAVKIMGMQSSFLWLWPNLSCEAAQADIPRNVFLNDCPTSSTQGRGAFLTLVPALCLINSDNRSSTHHSGCH